VSHITPKWCSRRKRLDAQNSPELHSELVSTTSPSQPQPASRHDDSRQRRYILLPLTNIQQLTMPFIPHTPEALLPRSDSKNPAATCRGLTATGRPCRRPISTSSPSPIPGYCWQHQDQTPQKPPPTIRERTSVDTLVDRLGILKIKQKRRRPPPRPKPRSNLSLFCCIGEADKSRPPRPVKSHTKPARPPINRDPSSRELLSLIPPSASPQTTALLLAELAKPVSEKDDEGFIYMFWLTPETATPPSEASTLLAPDPGQRRTSDVLNTFATTTSTKKTILLKIGRAQNVQRRLNQWTRQCGYNISLIRYYPYHSPSTSSVNNIPRTPIKVPNAHKVERLIHMELNHKRAQGSGKCASCGREHREWFEVDASKNGVKAIDAVIRRWVDWGLRASIR